METEFVSQRYAALDAWEPAEVLDALIEGQLAAVAAVRAARAALGTAALATESRLRRGGRLVYAGAGTSARLAAQDGAELSPTFGWPRDRILFLLAGGQEALVRPIEGAEDDAEEGARLVRLHRVGSDDVLVAVAASGTTPFTLACLRGAKACGALTIGIANNAGTPLIQEADHGVWLDTGPEVIAGSTRLKAGTAQKIALNLMSSLVMIRMGRVYDGLMVDVQATNSKLIRRSEAMLMRLTGCSRDEVRDALDRSGGNVKLAVLVLRGCSLKAAREALDHADGQLRRALVLVGEERADPVQRR